MRSALIAGFAVLLASSLAAADVHAPDPASAAAAAARRRRRRAPASPSASATARGFVALKTPAPERILIRGGTFMMGSTDDEIEHARMICKREPLGEDGRCHLHFEDRGEDEPPFSDEASQHEVMVSDFWLDRTEVTNARYRRCVAAGRCALPPYSAGAERFDRPDFPVVLVNWPESVAFCEWDGGRLPTEAEWERAARGLNGRRYPWGEVYNPFLANHGQLAFDSHDGGDGFFELAPVGSFPDGRTPEGLEDMAGNAMEWVGDWYAKEYPRVSAVNPKGPEEGDFRVLRGGSYGSPRPRLRGAARNLASPGVRETDVGFRCVHPA